ncbi:MAG: methylated-DNA--[protein]-cysteine S-methyltransferase [Alphaproteobacteria bacterium]|nr:methylated-DNA--[protein]-cysteine S-methyltransferase [Alphaproteobacteria bacterium]
MDEKQSNYQRIEKAIDYIHKNFKQQPSLEDIAATVNLSPFHFQRVFTEWAGVSPKKFTQYISIGYSKSLLKKQNATLLDTAYDTGLSGTSRLHDLFVQIEGMTPGEYKNGANTLNINYSFAMTPFGQLIIGSTPKGVCYMAFEQNKQRALTTMQQRFPHATYEENHDAYQQQALSIFDKDWSQLDRIKLHLSGTPFQLKVWESLLKIPFAQLSTYGDIAQSIGKPKSARAVGTAIGKNPIAFLIPCHRVIQNTGHIGGYMWGTTKKSAIIGWEAAKQDNKAQN